MLTKILNFLFVTVVYLLLTTLLWLDCIIVYSNLHSDAPWYIKVLCILLAQTFVLTLIGILLCGLKKYYGKDNV